MSFFCYKFGLGSFALGTKNLGVYQVINLPKNALFKRWYVSIWTHQTLILAKHQKIFYFYNFLPLKFEVEKDWLKSCFLLHKWLVTNTVKYTIWVIITHRWLIDSIFLSFCEFDFYKGTKTQVKRIFTISCLCRKNGF